MAETSQTGHKNEILNSTYRTRDLAEAAALLAKGQELIETERQGKICWFVFSNASDSKKIVDKFWLNNCHVDAKTYHNAIERLKNEIFDS